MDFATTHLNEDSIRRLREKSVVVAIVPGGTTMYLVFLNNTIMMLLKNDSILTVLLSICHLTVLPSIF